MAVSELSPGLHGSSALQRRFSILTPTGSTAKNMVERLPKSPGIYSIYMDNYFTSVALFQLLYKRAFGARGTTRSDRKDFPEEVQHVAPDRAIPLGHMAKKADQSAR
jgi:hypothetical protein